MVGLFNDGFFLSQGLTIHSTETRGIPTREPSAVVVQGLTRVICCGYCELTLVKQPIFIISIVHHSPNTQLLGHLLTHPSPNLAHPSTHSVTRSMTSVNKYIVTLSP